MDSGYLIVKTFERVYRDYLELRDMRNYPLPNDRVIYSVPLKGMSPKSYSKRYRGVSRDPLFPWDERDEEIFRGSDMVEQPTDTELKAHLAIGELKKQNQPDNEIIICSHEDAIRVFGLIEPPVEREVIWIRKANCNVAGQQTYPLLGYEPAWWGGDWFSAISDCLCFPMWHGTDTKGVLFKEYYERLNRHALFDTADIAKDFLKFYRSFDWTETGEYEIVEVRLVEEAT